MIKKNSVVNLSYCLKNAAGEELDRTDKSQPFAYLHGTGQIVPGLENALEGLAVGAKKRSLCLLLKDTGISYRI
jgi:FKBP-type peptidyl-prolyl cis-trans isomerase SlyD